VIKGQIAFHTTASDLQAGIYSKQALIVAIIRVGTKTLIIIESNLCREILILSYPSKGTTFVTFSLIISSHLVLGIQNICLLIYFPAKISQVFLASQ
jgi:hypothetical protein